MQPFSKAALEPFLKGPFICRSDAQPDNSDVTAFPSAAPARPARLTRRTLVAWLLAACSVGLQPAWAGKDDHERARRAVLAGEVLPLPTVLERLQREQPGQVMEVELEQDDGRWVYEIKLLAPGGQLLKLKLDAQTAAVLRRKSDDGRSGGPGAPR
jgi:Peptidase propeptide and YPEB domain